jgi:hypothetical protein
LYVSSKEVTMASQAQTGDRRASSGQRTSTSSPDTRHGQDVSPPRGKWCPNEKSPTQESLSVPGSPKDGRLSNIEVASTRASLRTSRASLRTSGRSSGGGSDVPSSAGYGDSKADMRVGSPGARQGSPRSPHPGLSKVESTSTLFSGPSTTLPSRDVSMSFPDSLSSGPSLTLSRSGWRGGKPLAPSIAEGRGSGNFSSDALDENSDDFVLNTMGYGAQAKLHHELTTMAALARIAMIREAQCQVGTASKQEMRNEVKHWQTQVAQLGSQLKPVNGLPKRGKVYSDRFSLASSLPSTLRSPRGERALADTLLGVARSPITVKPLRLPAR